MKVPWIILGLIVASWYAGARFWEPIAIIATWIVIGMGVAYIQALAGMDPNSKNFSILPELCDLAQLVSIFLLILSYTTA